ncbi:MAG: ribosome maturation factor RimM [Actinomycetaceae bacterium]|nr:ribosome maturation factor RimM [Actinomycetaceae bacterium]
MDVVVAEVGSAHALKGEVYLNLRTDVPEERIYPGAELRTQPAGRGPLTVATIRVHKGRLVVRFEEVKDRTGAEAIRGVKLIADSDDIEDEDDAWYAHELEGMRVQTESGEDLGVVRDLILGDAQDLLVVDFNGREVLVPFVEQIVPEVDEEAGVILVDPPGGLFDDEEA